MSGGNMAKSQRAWVLMQKTGIVLWLKHGERYVEMKTSSELSYEEEIKNCELICYIKIVGQ